MYDMSIPNAKPGTCEKCRGSGVYSWGASVNGRMAKSGKCHSCQGTGRQTTRDMARNKAYNRHKLATLAWG